MAGSRDQRRLLTLKARRSRSRFSILVESAPEFKTVEAQAGTRRNLGVEFSAWCSPDDDLHSLSLVT